MGQVTIYLDADTEKLMEAAANSAGVSKSKWIAELIRAKTRPEWPLHLRELAGAWTDMPTAEDLRSNRTKDVKRETL